MPRRAPTLSIVLLLGATACAPEAPPAETALALGPHQPARVRGAQVVGRVAAEDRVDLVLGLRHHDEEGMKALLARQADPRSSDFRHWLTPDQFAEAYGPSAAEYEEAAASIEAAGLSVTRRLSGRSALSVQGRAADIEELFGTELLLWEDARRSGSARFRAPSKGFRVPAALASIVDTVVGLDDADAWVSHRQGPRPGVDDPNALPGGAADPIDLRTLYDAEVAEHPLTHQPLLGAGETIAILGTGYGPGTNDLKGFVNKYALPTSITAQYARVSLGGDNRDPAALANEEYYENVLDVDMVLAMAPLANVVHVLVATNQPGMFSDGVAFIVNQLPQAHAVSVSYGSCESVSIYETLQLNSFFLQAELQGQAWFIASGDNGTDACRDASSDGVPGVDWPSSSPYTFGVGGTELSGGTEVAWNAGGGGQSQLFPKPDWQTGVGPFPDDGVREVPDVAALAGEPGVSTVFGNTAYPSYGTSAAAPIWAGVWALVDEARGNVGMADYHERVYTLGKLSTGAFKDITMGVNSDGTTPGYPALVGFDLATGWGAPNVALLVGGLP